MPCGEPFAQSTDLRHDDPMDLETWDDLDLAYLLAFGEHPELKEADSA